MRASSFEQRRLSERELAEHQIAGLTALEAAICIIARAIVATYPPVNRLPRPGEPTELRSARRLLDDCEGLLVSLDAHRRAVSVHLPTGDPDHDGRSF
jgi:hypothetical protein